MTPPGDQSVLFEDAVDVPLWLEDDRDTPYAERTRRDRAIAHRLSGADAAARVRAWWRLVETDSRPGAGRRLAGLRSIATLAMLALGSLSGALMALAAFHYDGTHPVNVVRLLALLVVPQLVLIVLTLLMMPPGLPGLRAVQNALRAVNPGVLAESLFRRLARGLPELPQLFGETAGRSAASGRFAKWQLLYWSQAAAAAFNVAALATAAMLIAFTDLAFGWSTTLAAEPALVARFVAALAWPWQALWPEAVPSVELIERSQYFRLESAGESVGSPRDLASWWSFSVLAITAYGLLPRLALLSVAGWRLRAATRALLLEDSRVTALLDRMAEPDVETAAPEHEEAPPDEQIRAAPPPPGLGGRARGVIWSYGLGDEAVREIARRRLGIELTDLVEAGRSPELGADLEAADRIAAGAGPLVVFTPAWEPPLLEFLDFLGALRERAGPEPSIVVTPVPERDEPVGDVERETWARAVGRLADPRIYVETGAA